MKKIYRTKENIRNKESEIKDCIKGKNEKGKKEDKEGGWKY